MRGTLKWERAKTKQQARLQALNNWEILHHQFGIPPWQVVPLDKRFPLNVLIQQVKDKAAELQQLFRGLRPQIEPCKFMFSLRYLE